MVYLTPKEYMAKVFPFSSDLVVEVGFGNGVYLRWLAENKKGTIVGIDIANIAFQKAKSRLQGLNVYTLKSEAYFYFKYMVKPQSVSEVYILYPDPWPKNKKRRLIDADFAKLLVSRLKIGGAVYVATDDEDYASQIWEVFSGVMNFHSWHPEIYTKYMRKWENMGRDIYSWKFVKSKECHVEFLPALTSIVLPLNYLSLKAPCILRKREIVLKLDSIYLSISGEKAVYKFIISERNFSTAYFAVFDGSYLKFLNTWGEVFHPSVPSLISALK